MYESEYLANYKKKESVKRSLVRQFPKKDTKKRKDTPRLQENHGWPPPHLQVVHTEHCAVQASLSSRIRCLSLLKVHGMLLELQTRSCTTNEKIVEIIMKELTCPTMPVSRRTRDHQGR
jgi:hypothetical protein